MGQIFNVGTIPIDTKTIAPARTESLRAEIVQAKSRLRDLEETLKDTQAVALAGQFAAATIHEINGPLEAVTNLNYLLRINSEQSGLVRDYSNMIDEQLAFLGGITRETLSYYRTQHNSEIAAISILVEAALRIHRHKILGKEIKLIKDLPADVLALVHPGSMLQVFSNLISNAVEALPAKGTLWLRVRCSKMGVHILIADGGHGIPAPIHSRIFEPFFSTKNERGTGLGLAISKSIIEKHSGRIRSRTSTNAGRSGTAFRISLPLPASPEHTL